MLHNLESYYNYMTGAINEDTTLDTYYEPYNTPTLVIPLNIQGSDLEPTGLTLGPDSKVRFYIFHPGKVTGHDLTSYGCPAIIKIWGIKGTESSGSGLFIGKKADGNRGDTGSISNWTLSNDAPVSESISDEAAYLPRIYDKDYTDVSTSERVLLYSNWNKTTMVNLKSEMNKATGANYNDINTACDNILSNAGVIRPAEYFDLIVYLLFVVFLLWKF